MLISDIQKHLAAKDKTTNQIILKELTVPLTGDESNSANKSNVDLEQGKGGFMSNDQPLNATTNDKSARDLALKSSSNHQVNNLSNTFFNVKNFIFKIIVPVVLFSTFVFIFNLPNDKPSFYRRPPFASSGSHGNEISNHNDGISDQALGGCNEATKEVVGSGSDKVIVKSKNHKKVTIISPANDK